MRKWGLSYISLKYVKNDEIWQENFVGNWENFYDDNGSIFSMSWVISHAWVVLAIFLGLAIFYFHHCMLANLTYFRTVGQGHVIISRFEIKRFNYIPFFETRSFGYIPTISREPVTQIWISKEFWGFFLIFHGWLFSFELTISLGKKSSHCFWSLFYENENLPISQRLFHFDKAKSCT